MSSDEDPGFDDFAAAFDTVADEAEALVAEDATGGGYLLMHLREAAEEIRGGRTDDALASLDAAEGWIEQIREKVRALERGELP